MLLAIDIGNTKIAAGLFGNDGTLMFVSSFLTDKNKTADQCAIDISNIFSLYQQDIKRVDGAIISSVVPPLTNAIFHSVCFLTGIEPMILGPGTKTGLNIRMQSHSELGEDIVACAVGAVNKYEPPLIIIDFGTAVTFSAISSNSVFIGGAIYPGVTLALNALSKQTAQLPFISLGTARGAVGRNTIDSMRAGIVYGTAGMIDALINEIRNEIGAKARIIATGERIECILEKSRADITFDKDLLMEGLYQIYRRNA